MRILYRAAAVLLLLFAAGHQLGFRTVDPTWHAEAVVQAMQATRFQVQGFERDYWGFFTGFGFNATAFFIFSAIVAWSLASVPEAAGRLPLVRWSFAATYVLVAITSWVYFFAVPGILATLVALSLVAAAALPGDLSSQTKTEGTAD